MLQGSSDKDLDARDHALSIVWGLWVACQCLNEEKDFHTQVTLLGGRESGLDTSPFHCKGT